MRSVLERLIVVLYLDQGISMKDPGFGVAFWRKGKYFLLWLSGQQVYFSHESITCSMHVCPVTYLRLIGSSVECFPETMPAIPVQGR